MGVISYKTWYDVWEHKGRTLQVVLIIAIGAFAIGTTLGARALISRDINQTWQATNPPMIGLWVDPPVEQAVLDALGQVEGVAVIEGGLQQSIKWRLSPDEPWQSAELIARPDYEDQRISRLTLDAGAWPARKTIGVERGHALGPGDRLYLELEDKVYPVELGGVIYNTTAEPAGFGGGPTFYTSRERFEQLTGEGRFNQIYARLAHYDPAEATATADRLQTELEKQDYTIGPLLPDDNRTAPPEEHFIQDDLNAVFFLLTAMAGAALVLGLFLVYNTITAIISQQINQIGMMKAVGATFAQILLVFFSQVIVYALLAVLLAVPLGMLGAQGLRLLLVGMFNMTPGPVTLLPQVILVQAAVAMLAPLLVAVGPIFVGARVTVREAINSYGLGGTASLLDRLLIKSHFLPRSLALTVSNTFRHKWRVFFTQLTLVGSGLIFMMVMNTEASLRHTFSEVLFSVIEANVFLSFDEAERIKNIEALALTHPEVAASETWSFAGATLRPQGQPQSNDDRSASVRGIPLPTQTYRPELRAGRWLHPNDNYAVVLHQKLATEAGVGVGDWVTLTLPQQRESDWLVVGLIFDPFNSRSANVPREMLAKELRAIGLGQHLRVQTVEQDGPTEARVATELRTLYEANGYTLVPDEEDTAHNITEHVMSGGIAIIINLLAAMAVVIALVGGVALSGVLSINVLERRREIGVMRAIGASSLQILRIFIGEGLLLAWLSWLIAWPLSLPAGRLMVAGLQSIIGDELSYATSLLGPLYWLGLVTLLALIASWFPARSASRISVRESLAYL